jgi:hypothetical protein
MFRFLNSEEREHMEGISKEIKRNKEKVIQSDIKRLKKEIVQ